MSDQKEEISSVMVSFANTLLTLLPIAKNQTALEICKTAKHTITSLCKRIQTQQRKFKVPHSELTSVIVANNDEKTDILDPIQQLAQLMGLPISDDLEALTHQIIVCIKALFGKIYLLRALTAQA